MALVADGFTSRVRLYLYNTDSSPLDNVASWFGVPSFTKSVSCDIQLTTADFSLKYVSQDVQNFSSSYYEVFVKKGGYCGCCDACRTVIKEGDPCPAPVRGDSPPTSQCEEGTTCVEVGEARRCARNCR
ncbi:uncharacterized protein TNCV_2350851 [Trichonephila clavipes]|uniref:Uncharacterized protein n=1 Tax=Trichonephila clavipes TaxID=2585209 RepID=A0A8X6SME4_TRICX|nr:uncharacterized protein TNCV_2350851 [Trichonephila clavipes]